MSPISKSTAKDSPEESRNHPSGLQLAEFLKALTPFEGGKPETFHKFYASLQDVIIIFDIESDEQKSVILKQSLRGSALQWYTKFWNDSVAENDGETLAFCEIETAILDRYGSKDAPLVGWRRLVSTYQEGDLARYNEMFEKVVTEAGNNFISVEQLLTLQYISGLKPDLAHAVSQRNPSAWSEAAQYAVLRDCLQADTQFTNVKRPRAYGECNSEKTCAKKYRTRERERGIGTIPQHNRSLATKKYHCYNCQKVGHLAKDCKHARKQRPKKERIKRLSKVTDVVAIGEKHKHFLCQMTDVDPRSIIEYTLAELSLLPEARRIQLITDFNNCMESEPSSTRDTLTSN